MSLMLSNTRTTKVEEEKEKSTMCLVLLASNSFPNRHLRNVCGANGTTFF
jgi:hypothetical protein